MFGLILSDPTRSADVRQRARSLLAQLDIPFTGFTDEAASLFQPDMDLEAYLHAAVRALLTPGQPMPAELTLRYLAMDARPGNVIRRYVFLQLNLLPYLRVNRGVTDLPGAHLLGCDLLAAHFGSQNSLCFTLPGGEWCELYTGEKRSGCVREIRSINEPPLFVRAGTLLPIGVNDRVTDADDADRLTLHWYEPAGPAQCTLLSGERYDVSRAEDGAIHASSSSRQAWHLIVHQSGMETMIR